MLTVTLLQTRRLTIRLISPSRNSPFQDLTSHSNCGCPRFWRRQRGRPWITSLPVNAVFSLLSRPPSLPLMRFQGKSAPSLSIDQPTFLFYICIPFICIISSGSSVMISSRSDFSSMNESKMLLLGSCLFKFQLFGRREMWRACENPFRLWKINNLNSPRPPYLKGPPFMTATREGGIRCTKYANKQKHTLRPEC